MDNAALRGGGGGYAPSRTERKNQDLTELEFKLLLIYTGILRLKISALV